MATEIRKGDRAPRSRNVQDITRRGSTALYGRSGSGKTTLAETWPKPILYLNIRDNGDDSIRDSKDVDVVDIETSEQLEEQMLWLAKQANKGKLIYKTVIADTVTQLQGILVEELGEKKKSQLKGKKAGDFGTLTKQDWGSIAGDLKAFIMDLRNLPVESVFICQERIFNAGDEEDDGLGQIEPEVGPKLMPSVKNDLNASVSIIGNTFIRLKIKTVTNKDGKKEKQYKKIYCLRIGPNEVYTTKIRKPKRIEVPDYIVDPDFAKIKKMMKGSK